MYDNAYLPRDDLISHYHTNVLPNKQRPENAYNISTLKKRQASDQSDKKKRKGQASLASARRTVQKQKRITDSLMTYGVQRAKNHASPPVISKQKAAAPTQIINIQTKKIKKPKPEIVVTEKDPDNSNHMPALPIPEGSRVPTHHTNLNSSQVHQIDEEDDTMNYQTYEEQ